MFGSILTASLMVVTQSADTARQVGPVRANRLQVRRFFPRLLDEPGRNVLMLKMSYWLSR